MGKGRAWAAFLRAGLCAIALACASAEPARADDPPATPEAVAERVVAARKAKDEGALRDLARLDAPDPWLVADALLARGEREAADAFARAAPRLDVEKLPEYVAAWKAAPGDAAAREAITAGNAALMQEKYADALAAFEKASGETTPVPGARLRIGRAIALSALRRPEESARAFAQSVAEAERLGWRSRLSQALDGLVTEEYRARRLQQALEAAERLVANDTARAAGKPTLGMARAHGIVGTLLRDLGRLPEAAESWGKKVAILRDVGEPRLVASTLNDLATLTIARGQPEEAIRLATEALGIAGAGGLHAEASRSHSAIGKAQRALGRLPIAIARHEDAFAAAEKAQDENRMAEAALEVGAALGDRNEKGDQEKALPWHRRAAELYAGAGNRYGSALALCNLADSELGMGRDEEARATAERALALAREIPAAWPQGRAHSLIGEIEGRTGSPAASLTAYVAAEAAYREAGDRTEAARAAAGASEAHRRAGDLGKSREAADRALKEAEEIGNRGLLAFCLFTAAFVRRDQGEREAALPLARRAIEAYRAVENAHGVSEAEALVKALEAPPPK